MTFFRVNWALSELGRNFRHISKIYARKLWKIFSKLCTDDLGSTNLFACLKLDHKVMIEKKSALTFASMHISYVKHSEGVSTIYHDQMDIMEQATTNILNFHLTKHFGQSVGWPSQQATENRQANERPELFWPSFPIWQVLTVQSRSLIVIDDKKSCLIQIQVQWDFVDFYLQCE